jgi:RNA polymerase sigma-70 factor (ECF subfamily)
MDQAGAADADLAERINQGDERAEGDLYRRYGPGIRQILIRATGDLSVAEELCQETLIIVLKRLRNEPLSDPTRLAAFIAQTARNLAIAEHRKQKRRQTTPASDELENVMDETKGQESEAELQSVAAAVRVLLGELRSSRDRLLLIRYYLRDEDRESICRDLGLTEPSFNVVLFRARNRFLQLLQKKGIGRGDLFCFAIA